MIGCASMKALIPTWTKRYLGPGEKFVAMNYAVTIGASGYRWELCGADSSDAYLDPQFGGRMVGEKREKNDAGWTTHKPVFVDAENGRFYYVHPEYE
jgi:hypothetical protein